MVAKSWAAAASGNWTTKTSWTPSGAPAATDDTTISIAGTYTVTVNAGATANTLSVGNAG